MPRGKVVLSKAFYDRVTPEVLAQVDQFFAQGSLVEAESNARDYVWTLDHADFEATEQPANYLLHFERRYDPATNSDRPVLCKLTMYDEVAFKIRTVKEYTREQHG